MIGTACNKPDDFPAVLDSGANDYVPNPFDLPLLQIRLSITERQIRDIKRRHKAEVLHQTVLLTAMDGFCIFGADQKLHEVNDAYCQISGYSQAELLTKKLSDLEAVKSGADIRKHIDTVLETGGDRIETQHRRKDGALIDLEISIKRLGRRPDAFFAFLTDVTAKNQAEKSLKFWAPGTGTCVSDRGKFHRSAGR